jgi:hypothetical protein
LQYARLLTQLGAVSGRLTDDRGAPVDAAEIVAEPGGFQATSLPDGTFLLLARPGSYALQVTKDGFADARLDGVVAASGESPGVVLGLTPRLGTTLRNAGFEDGDLRGWTRWGDVDGVQAGPWFFDVVARDGGQFLGTAVNCGAKDGGLYQSVSTAAGTIVTVSALTLTHRDGPAAIGNRLGIDPWGGTDPRSANIIWGDPVETGGQWQPILLTARAESDRVTVFLAHDQDAANPWNLSAYDDVRLEQMP